MTAQTVEFNLSTFVAEIRDSHPDVRDPRTLADMAADAVPEPLLREALALTLRSYVYGQQAYDAKHPTAVMRRADRRNPTPQNQSGHIVGRQRERWATLCNGTVNVEGARKAIGDLTIADFDIMAQVRDEIAAKNAAWAARYRRVGALLTAAGVDSLKRLPAAQRQQAYDALTADGGYEMELTP